MDTEIVRTKSERALHGVPTNDTLALLSELKDELYRFPSATPEDCWITIQAIEASLGCDPQCSPEERELVQHLKSAVSDVIAGHWEGVPVPPRLAVLPLSTLCRLIRRRR